MEAATISVIVPLPAQDIRRLDALASRLSAEGTTPRSAPRRRALLRQAVTEFLARHAA